MTKKEIFEKLNKISLDTSNFIVIGDASIVCHGIIKNSESIKVLSLVPFEVNGIEVEVVNKLNKTDEINGFQFQKLEDCLNEIDDKNIIKKIELYLDCLDTYKNERKLRKEGYTLIGGVDEVGRGPLVGPVVAACCILPEKFNLDGLTDSKKLTEKKRDYFFEEIKKQAISYGIGIVDEKRIDEINIYQATKEAMIQAINNCNIKPEYVLTDAMKLDLDIPVKPIIKGDLRSITISAASVLAKVTRDRMMYELDKKYPMYDFKNNVGYPTKKHLEAIAKYGIIPEHRRSYGPVKEYLEKNS
ncbi:MAG: ribonuclease HII [Bacilli bacterium]|nr:ribonuclease HII [Bacilli bacterium]